jgi:PAS domain S-box-containing protein
MDYRLEDIVDIPLLQELQDKLNVIYSFPSAIVDNDGKILTAVAWQDICTKFHRVHPECEKECIKSDKYIADHLHEANPAVSYECPHGLIDNATPIIIDGKHLGNFFTGQFFLEKPDLEFFKKQAEKYGFDEKDYLEAVEKVPIWSKEKVAQYLDFIKGFIEIIAGIGLKNLEEIRINKTLKETEERYRTLFEGAPDAIFLADPETGIIVDANHSASRLLGRAIEDIIGMRQEELHPPQLADYSKDTFNQHIKQSVTKGNTFPIEHVVLRADGTQVPIEVLGQMVFVNGKELLMGTFRDITDRKHSEKILMDIIDKNPMAIQILDMDGYTIQTNSAHAKLFGAVTPREYSILKDQQLLKQGFGELFDRIKNGEVVSFPDSNYNAHNVDPSFPDFTIAVKAIGFTLNDSNGIPERIVLMQENITERKHAEQNLKDIIEKNPMSIQIVDKDGFTLQGNPSYINLFGTIPPPDFSIFDDLQSKSPELEKIILQAKTGSLAYLPDIYYNPHDISPEFPDNPVWVRALIFPLNDSNGKPERFVFMHENITERKKAEEALKESEEKFRSLVETAQELVWKCDTNACFTYLNPAWEKTHGYKIDEMLGKSFSDFQPKEIFERDVKEFSRHLAGGFVKEYETNHIAKDGSELTLLFNAVPLFAKDGTIVGTQGTAVDITERKRSEEALKESEEKLSSLFDAMTEMVVMHELVFNEQGETVNYRILDCNDAFTKTTGIKKENAIGKLATEAYQTVFPPYLEEYTRVGITGESLEFTTFFEPMDMHFAISVVSPKKNQFSTITSNITDRKKAELELQSQNLEIEAQYEEYMQLNEVLRQTNYDLELAKNHAEQSDKLKTTFLQNISHEIRTPLNGIMGFSTLLKDFDELTVHEKTEYINLIIGSSERLLSMIDDVLIISSLDSKIINADQSEFKLSELISDFNALYYTNTKSKGLKFSVNVAKDCSELFITTDKNKLYQIVTNLLNNALKFTNKGEIELGVIRYEKTLKLYVKDTGIGIKSDYIDKIYDRFWQYEAFTKDFYGGTGLGLAISSGLAYLLGIDISVESEFGVGTTFTLTLKQDSVKDIAIKPSKTEVQNKVQMDFHDLNILIVEDEETNYCYLNTLLRKVGAKSDLARDGKEAIEMTEKKDYDLILMDLKMPVMDGFESTRQIRSKNKDVIIIAQSAYTQSEEKQRALGAGCNDYLVKPIRIDDFYNVINQVTKRKSE